SEAVERLKAADAGFARFLRHNVHPHKAPGYALVDVSLKTPGQTPGDMTSDQMNVVADLAETYSLDEVRVNYTQNLLLPHVKLDDLPAVYAALQASGLATPNIDLISDIIACPGLDYCALANARSIPISLELNRRFDDLDYLNDVGPCSIKISGCINACGHHHVANIGILGINKHGAEAYQLTLGGNDSDSASIGRILGPSFDEHGIVDAVAQVVATYLELRSSEDETFLECYRRLGDKPFKAAVYQDGAAPDDDSEQVA
ncbi:MAG TPA: nitrite/sulfite reductase, partial [Polyangiaceae bacterium]|nr:nitrite/sulfite reductase [Polyangiaceae bacterium]